MVHVTDVKSTMLMEQVADDYQQLGKQGRFSKTVYSKRLHTRPQLDKNTQKLRPTHQASKTRAGSH